MDLEQIFAAVGAAMVAIDVSSQQNRLEECDRQISELEAHKAVALKEKARLEELNRHAEAPRHPGGVRRDAATAFVEHGLEAVADAIDPRPGLASQLTAIRAVIGGLDDRITDLKRARRTARDEPLAAITAASIPVVATSRTVAEAAAMVWAARYADCRALAILTDNADAEREARLWEPIVAQAGACGLLDKNVPLPVSPGLINAFDLGADALAFVGRTFRATVAFPDSLEVSAAGRALYQRGLMSGQALEHGAAAN